MSIGSAGLGVRELVFSAFAPHAELEPASASIATAGDQFTELAILILLSLPIVFASRHAVKKPLDVYRVPDAAEYDCIA